MSQIKGLISPLLERWRMKKATKFVKGDSLLDIGCGEGKILRYVKIKDYTGIDYDADSIFRLSHDSGLLSIPVKTIRMEVDENSKIEGKFDNIVMLAFIEHVKNPVKFLKNLKNNLKHRKKHGRIIITTPGPLAEWIHKIGSKVGLFDKEAGEEHKKIFNKEELYGLASEAGLRVIHYSTFEFGLNNLMVMEIETRKMG